MSEEQQNTPPSAKTEEYAPHQDDASDTLTPLSSDETDEADGEAPKEIKVFGLSRSGFHAVALGIAFGFILAGLIGILFDMTISPMICVVACGAIGFFLFKLHERKQNRDTSRGDP